MYLTQQPIEITVWHNDSQIVSLQAVKFYDECPRLEITVWKWSDQ